MKMHGEAEVQLHSLLTFQLDRCQVVGFKPKGKILWGPLNKKLVEVQSRFGLFWRKEKIYDPLPGTE
jgi:hypothetical protein